VGIEVERVLEHLLDLSAANGREGHGGGSHVGEDDR
jgi:hypothetical protein